MPLPVVSWSGKELQEASSSVGGKEGGLTVPGGEHLHVLSILQSPYCPTKFPQKAVLEPHRSD